MVAEPLLSQQPRKLWIMSVAVLGKQAQRSSRIRCPCGVGCGAQLGELEGYRGLCSSRPGKA